MRCPNCGTENAPDSRFCGGCGAAIAAPAPQQQRLAPTAKIPDDAPLAPPTVRPSGAQAPVSYSPPSMPPTAPPAGNSMPPQRSSAQDFGSLTPTAPQPRQPAGNTVQRAPQNSMPQSSRVSQASLSFSAPVTRPLGLIALVLIIDLGLAGAGAFLLMKGLENDEAPATTSEPKPELKSEAPAATPAPAAAPAPEPSPAAEPAPAVEENVKTTTPPVPEKKDTPKAKADTPKAKADTSKTKSESKPVTSPSASPGPVTSPSASLLPQNPYEATPAAVPVVSTETEINKLLARSKNNFATCAGGAPVAGQIQVAFQVLSDGNVANAAAVQNTTGDAQLANCLVAIISRWQVSPHQGTALSFVRPFNYP